MSKKKKWCGWRCGRTAASRRAATTSRARTRKTRPRPRTATGERVRAKGDSPATAPSFRKEPKTCPPPRTSAVRGRVIRVHGLASVVEADDGRIFRCAVRRLLENLATDERSVVTTGDIVWIRPAGASSDLAEGVIERVEPRHGVLTRESRRREHVLVANVDQVVIVMSLVEPDLKPHLIDRYLAAAQKGGLKPILCLNKADLADPVALQPLVGAYAQLGIPTFSPVRHAGAGHRPAARTAPRTGHGLLRAVRRRQVVAPERGPAGARAVREVRERGEPEGPHTTTYCPAHQARASAAGWWTRRACGSSQLWDIAAGGGRRLTSPSSGRSCRCAASPTARTRTRTGCAVKTAVARRQISRRRYHSYLGMYKGDDV